MATGNVAPQGHKVDYRRRKPSKVDPVTWAYTCRKVWNGDALEPLNHAAQPYMVEPLMETALRIEEGAEYWSAHTLTFLKGRQVGGTTAGMTLNLWYLDTYGGKVIHCVPTQSNAETIKRTLHESVADTTFKNIEPETKAGGSNRYFKGKGARGHKAGYMTGHLLGGNSTSSGDNFRGKTARIVVFDERGQIPNDAVAVVKRTLTTAPMNIILNIGSARDKDDKLDQNYLSGSRGEWVIPCDCGAETTLCPYGSTLEDLASSIEPNEGGYHYACHACRGPIDPMKGHWIHQEIGAHLSYHLSSLNSPLVSPQDIADLLDSPDESETDLYRETMGIPHGGEGLTLFPHDMQEVPEPRSFASRVVGIDWGGGAGADIRHGKSYYVALGLHGDLVHVTTCGEVGPMAHDEHVPSLWAQISPLHPKYVACDFGAEGGRNDKLHRYASCVYTIKSNLLPRPGNVVHQVVKQRDVPRTYNVVKTYVYERLVNDIIEGRVVFNPGTEAVRDHLLKVRPSLKGKDGFTFVSYSTSSQHYAACLLYAYAIYIRKEGRQKRSVVGRGNAMLKNR